MHKMRGLIYFWASETGAGATVVSVFQGCVYLEIDANNVHPRRHLQSGADLRRPNALRISSIIAV